MSYKIFSENLIKLGGGGRIHVIHKYVKSVKSIIKKRYK